MTLPKLVTLATLAACGAYAQDQTTPPTFEELKSLIGAKLSVRTNYKGKLQGRLTQVTSEHVVIESIDAKRLPTYILISDIHSVEEIHFRGSQTDMILRKTRRAVAVAFGATLYYPGALILEGSDKLLEIGAPYRGLRPSGALRKTGHALLAVPATALLIPGFTMALIGDSLLHPALEWLP